MGAGAGNDMPAFTRSQTCRELQHRGEHHEPLARMWRAFDGNAASKILFVNDVSSHSFPSLADETRERCSEKLSQNYASYFKGN